MGARSAGSEKEPGVGNLVTLDDVCVTFVESFMEINWDEPLTDKEWVGAATLVVCTEAPDLSSCRCSDESECLAGIPGNSSSEVRCARISQPLVSGRYVAARKANRSHVGN